MNQAELDEVIARLRRQKTDDATTEVKACAQQLSKSIWETVSAFANTTGGTLVLGLSEDEGFKPVTSFDIKRVESQLVTGLGDGDPQGTRIEPKPPYALYDGLAVEGSPVLVVQIEELGLSHKPCFIKSRGLSGSFGRIGDRDVKLSPRQIYSLQNALRPSQADRAIVDDADVSDLSTELINRLTTRSSNARMFKDAPTEKEKLIRANVTDKRGGITLAGLLTCGTYPQQFYPRLNIDVALHAGTEKSDPSVHERFLDRVVCEGATGEVIGEAYAAIVRNLRTRSIIEGAGRKDVLEIPPDAIREALANAVVHREYSEPFLGQAIQVDIYADRIEVISPGGLWGGKTLENLDDGTSECRNKTLMKLMACVPGTEGDVTVEGNGTGIALMRNAMASRFLEELEFEAGVDYFKVIFRREGDRTHKPDRRFNDSAHASLPRDDVDARKERQYWSESEWRERIIDVLGAGKAMTVKEISHELERKPAITNIHLKAMIEDGLVGVLPPSGERSKRYSLMPL